jgi:hypothetical protein
MGDKAMWVTARQGTPLRVVVPRATSVGYHEGEPSAEGAQSEQ